MDIAGVDVEIDVIKEYPELEDLVVNPSTEDQSFNSSKYGFKSVKINAIKGEELDLTPSTEEQVAMGVFSKVKVNPIESQKLSATPTTEEQVITGLFDTVVVNPIQSEELYAVPSTEEQIKTGLFNTVVVSPIQGETLNLAPTEEQQNFEGVYLGVNINPIQTEEITTDLDFSGSDSIELTAQEGVYIKKATINKDANLTPENIKSGVSIAGISGEVADTSDADATSDDIAKGKSAYVNNEKVVGTMEVNENNALVDLTISTGTSSTSGLNQIIKKIPEDIVVNGTSANYLFNECSALEEVIGLDMSNVTSMISTFKNCTSLKKIDISNTSNVTNMYQMFYYCTSLETISKLDVSEVTNANYMFQGCTKLKSIPVLNFSKMRFKIVQV